MSAYMVGELLHQFFELLNTAIFVAFVGSRNGTVVVFFFFDIRMVPEVGRSIFVHLLEFVIFFFESLDEFSSFFHHFLILISVFQRVKLRN